MWGQIVDVVAVSITTIRLVRVSQTNWIGRINQITGSENSMLICWTYTIYAAERKRVHAYYVAW